MFEISRLISENEQDRAEAESWWLDTTDEAKLLVWRRIQREPTDDIDGLVLRFAQLAFCGMAERMHDEQ